MKTKQYAAILLSLLLPAVFAGCGSDAANPSGEAEKGSNTPSAVETAVETEPASPFCDDLPEDIDLGGYQVRIFGAPSFNITSEDSADIINDLLYKRNLAIEERLNCDVAGPMYDGNGWDVFQGLVIRAVMAGDDEFDAIMGNQWWATPLTFNNVLYNLTGAPYLQLDEPWWGTRYINGFSYKNHTFWLVGPLDLDWINAKHCFFFNKRMWASIYPDDDLYQLVRDGGWTLEAMNGYAKDVYQDLNGNNEMDDGDQYGMIFTECFDGAVLACGCGVEITSFDADGVPSIRFTQEPDRLIDFWDKFFPIRGGSEYYNVPGGGRLDVDTFVNNRILFSYGFLEYTTTKLRGMDDDYGILPLPKLDTAQEHYISVMKDSIHLYGIPTTVTEAGLNAACAVLEASASFGYKTLQPAYYEYALVNKFIRDEESVEVIDILSAYPVCDFGLQYYDLGFAEFMGAGKTAEMASRIEKVTNKFANTLAGLLKKLEEQA